jgi:DNA repair protein RAD5
VLLQAIALISYELCLNRLRRAVLHPSLVQVKEHSEDEKEDVNGDVNVNSLIARYTEGTEVDEAGPSTAFAEGVLGRLQEADGQECAVCFDLMDLPVLVPNCLHSWWVEGHLYSASA